MVPGQMDFSKKKNSMVANWQYMPFENWALEGLRWPEVVLGVVFHDGTVTNRLFCSESDRWHGHWQYMPSVTLALDLALGVPILTNGMDASRFFGQKHIFCLHSWGIVLGRWTNLRFCTDLGDIVSTSGQTNIASLEIGTTCGDIVSTSEICSDFLLFLVSKSDVFEIFILGPRPAKKSKMTGAQKWSF